MVMRPFLSRIGGEGGGSEACERIEKLRCEKAFQNRCSVGWMMDDAIEIG